MRDDEEPDYDIVNAIPGTAQSSGKVSEAGGSAHTTPSKRDRLSSDASANLGASQHTFRVHMEANPVSRLPTES